VDHDLGGARPRQPGRGREGVALSRTRSGCSTPPSPTTPASRSIRASTS
jgi:hypothetical protein